MLVDARRSRRRRDRRVRRVRLRARARTHRAVLLVVLRRLRRAREGPRVRRRRATRRRALGRGRRCAIALSTLLRLFAPFLPYVTEEVWSWWRDGFDPPRRVAATAARSRLDGGDPLVYEVAADVLAAVRKVKSSRSVSLATPVARVVRASTPRAARRARSGARPTCATRARSPRSRPRPAPSCAVEVELAGPDVVSTADRASTAAGVAERARQPREPVNVPARAAGAAAPTLERIAHADAVPRLARARVPGGPPHRHERQDHDDRDDHRAARDASG